MLNRWSTLISYNWKYRNMFVTIAEGTASRLQEPWRSNFKKKQKKQESKKVFSSPNTPQYITIPVSTYNTPTIITWSGPWRNVILYEKTEQSLMTDAHFHVGDFSRRTVMKVKGLTCMNLYFSILCMMMGRMTDRREEKRSRAEEDNLKNVIFITLNFVAYSFLVRPWWSERWPPEWCLLQLLSTGEIKEDLTTVYE